MTIDRRIKKTRKYWEEAFRASHKYWKAFRTKKYRKIRRTKTGRFTRKYLRATPYQKFLERQFIKAKMPKRRAEKYAREIAKYGYIKHR